MDTKKIKILTKGVLPINGFIYGPVLTPYNEKIKTIFELLSANVNVVEVLNNGKEVTLNTSNFDKDNNEHTTQVVHDIPKQEKSEKPVESVVKESIVEKPQSQQQNFNNYKKNKRNKNNSISTVTVIKNSVEETTGDTTTVTEENNISKTEVDDFKIN